MSLDKRDVFSNNGLKQRGDRFEFKNYQITDCSSKAVILDLFRQQAASIKTN
jgi:hypothetical protein